MCQVNRCCVCLYRQDTDEETTQNVELPATSDDIPHEGASSINPEADKLINELTAKLEIHRSEIEQLCLKLAKMETETLFSSRQGVLFGTISKNEKLVTHLTGLPTAGVFNIILELLAPCVWIRHCVMAIM